MLGQVVVPLSAYLEMALAASREVFGTGSHAIEDLVLQEALIVPPDESRDVQLVLTPGVGETAPFQIISLGETSGDRTRALDDPRDRSRPARRCSGSTRGRGARLPTSKRRAPLARPRSTPRNSIETSTGVGSTSAPLSGASGSRGAASCRQAIGEVTLPDSLISEAGRCIFHPAFLDACLHPLAAVWPAVGDATGTYMPLGVDSFRLYDRPADSVISHARLRPGTGASGRALVGDICLFDASGERLAEVKGLLLRATDHEGLRPAMR